jgi:hypothetical protein
MKSTIWKKPSKGVLINWGHPMAQGLTDFFLFNRGTARSDTGGVTVTGQENYAFVKNRTGPVGSLSTRFPNAVTATPPQVTVAGFDGLGVANRSMEYNAAAGTMDWTTVDRANTGCTAMALCAPGYASAAASRLITFTEVTNLMLMDTPQIANSGGLFAAAAFLNWGTNQLSNTSTRGWAVLAWRFSRDQNEGQKALFYDGKLSAKASITRPTDATDVISGVVTIGSVYQANSNAPVAAIWIWRGRALSDLEIAAYSMDPFQLILGRGFGSEGRDSAGNPRWGDFNICL